MKPQPPRAAADLFSKLSSAIMRGEFTPFLGAGASSLRDASHFPPPPPWDSVVHNISAIASQLRTQESLSFIQSFVAQRLGLPGDEVRKELDRANELAEVTMGDNKSPFYRNGLVHLQTELIHAAVRITEYFGQLFSAQTPSIKELHSCSVPFDSTTQEGDDTIRQLLKAAAIAQDLQTEPSEKCESPFLRHYKGVKRQLELQRIHEKLLTLIATLLGDQRERYASELARHKLGEKLPIPDDIDAGVNSEFGRLRLDAVHWMSELVWYTLRYWLPCYPTTAELAFEFSLRVAKAPTRRAELAQAAQALENEYSAIRGKVSGSLANDMATLIRYCESYQGEAPASVAEMEAFYYAVALASLHQYELYKDQCMSDDEPVLAYSEEGAEAADHQGEDSATLPLVFSTNFDNALERIFEEHDIGYHVVYPVIAGERRNGTMPVWRLRTWYPEKYNKVPTDERWVDVPKPPTVPHHPGQLLGPLVLKIHGSPCLKQVETGFRHWLVLSEAGYLEALATASNMPEWVRKQLGEYTKSRRSLWFLGYSMSDWNVRLRLFDHCKDGNRGFRGTVDREGDVYRTALLLNEKLHVEQWYADLSLLPQKILELFVIHQTGGSDKVKELVKRLRELLEFLEKRRGN